MDRKVDNKTNEELRLLNKVKSQSQTVGARVPNWLKAEILKGADEMGCTVGEYIAHVMYQHTQGQLIDHDWYNGLKEEYDRLSSENTSESDLHSQAIRDAEELREQRNELEAKRLRLSEEVKDLHKQLKAAQSEKQKLEERVKEQKDRADQKESDRKSEASKRQMLEQRLQKANTWINENTGGFLGLEYPGEF